MTDALAESYEYCRRVARSRARNFYYSFLLLSQERRNAMCAVYAFMRYCDDLSDEPGAKIEAIADWRRTLDRALAGDVSGHPVLPAFRDTVERFQIPRQYFYDMIEGVSSDLDTRHFQDFDALYRYCYQVASVVGLTIIHIFGFQSPLALLLAEKCGVAFQLTNILRDIREDAERGRIYLPEEDLRRFQVSRQDLERGRMSEQLLALLRFQADRARRYYEESREIVDLVHPRSRPSMWALIAIYSRLLDRIIRSGFDVFSRRVSLSAPEKVFILARAAVLPVSASLVLPNW